MYIFEIGNYEASSLYTETEKLLCKRLEACSRKTLPGVWRFTDSANFYAKKGPGRKRRSVRYRIYGWILMTLGVFVLVPGILEPRNPALIFSGAFALIAGAAELVLAGEKKTLSVPEPCRREAKELLEKLSAADFKKNPVKVVFDDCGMTVFACGEEQKIPYEGINEIFEEEHLWLLIYDNEKALLLQKCDLASGDAGEFAAYICGKIGAEAL